MLCPDEMFRTNPDERNTKKNKKKKKQQQQRDQKKHLDVAQIMIFA